MACGYLAFYEISILLSTFFEYLFNNVQVIQRRLDGSQLFNLSRAEYDVGFGNLCGEFFWGNSNLQTLMGSNNWQLKVSITDFDGNTTYITYPEFLVEKSNHNLKVPKAGTGTASE